MFQKNTRQNMGEMNIFACQTGSLRLALGVGGRTAVPLSAPKEDASSVGKGPVSGGGQMGGRTPWKAPGGGDCLEGKRALWQGARWGEMGSISKGMRQPEGPKAWKSLYIGEVQEVCRNGSQGVI